jgi:hypothetical protein
VRKHKGFFPRSRDAGIAVGLIQATFEMRKLPTFIMKSRSYPNLSQGTGTNNFNLTIHILVNEWVKRHLSRAMSLKGLPLKTRRDGTVTYTQPFEDIFLDQINVSSSASRQLAGQLILLLELVLDGEKDTRH